MIRDERAELRCYRCAAIICEPTDEHSRVRIGALIGRPPGRLWTRYNSPWPYIDLCISCSKALHSWVESGGTVRERSWIPTPEDRRDDRR